MHNRQRNRMELDPGKSHRLSVPAGTWLLVRSGRVEVHGPLMWISETMLCERTVLDEGQAHCIAHAGWIEVLAVDRAVVSRHAPASALVLALNGLWERCGRWLGREVRTRPGH